MLSEGTYLGKLKSAVLGQAKTGTPQMVLVFDIISVARGGQWEAMNQVERTAYLACTDGAWQYTEAKLKKLGFDGNFQEPAFNQSVFDAGIALTCTHRPSNRDGKPQENWDIADWGSGRQVQSASADVAMNLSARWRASASAPVPAGAPPVPQAAAFTAADGDIPF